ncbi:MAG TPA: lysophospholipid acyltransferase family protein [bacterium]|jgi:1-acyl-sn-glycerol-3-phosphate acyltransferase|nr:lysophospholipid acyltransferase family protein [bacterium]HON72511.1 lysophospholipid acyltransferase family protein [bacterium]
MFYWFAWIILRTFLTLFCRYRIEGLENVPRSGRVILVANHRAMIDPIVIGCGIHFRRTYFMAKEELFRFKPFAFIISSLGAFPVRRSKVDRSALRIAENLLKEERLILIFGEGTRNKDFSRVLGELHSGFVFLATRTGAPVVPVYTFNTHQIFKRFLRWPKVIIRFGKPIVGSEDLLERTRTALTELGMRGE